MAKIDYRPLYEDCNTLYKKFRLRKDIDREDLLTYCNDYKTGVLGLLLRIAEKLDVEISTRNIKTIVSILEPEYVNSFRDSFDNMARASEWLTEVENNVDNFLNNYSYKEMLASIKKTMKAFKNGIKDLSDIIISLGDNYNR